MTARPNVPLMLLAVVKSYLGALQLCNPQGVAQVSFIRLPRALRPFAGVPLSSMSLKDAERLSMVGCGLKGKLVWLLSQGVGHHFEPSRICSSMMQSQVRRVAAGLAAAVRDSVAKEAEELCASGQCAAALPSLQKAIDLGHLPSLALKAWLLVRGRESVAQDRQAAVKLACQGMGLGCHHCQGVMAYCHHVGFGNGTAEHPFTVDEARSLRLAMESSVKGSRYGEHTLGDLLYENSEEVLALNFEKAVMHYRLAAAQGLDEAQCSLGNMYHCGYGVPQNHTEALRLFQLAAAHGLPQASFNVARCHELGEGVPVDVEAAMCWYRRAQAGGHAFAENKLRQLALGDPWDAFPPPPTTYQAEVASSMQAATS